jgi:hypothetical protein
MFFKLFNLCIRWPGDDDDDDYNDDVDAIDFITICYSFVCFSNANAKPTNRKLIGTAFQTIIVHQTIWWMIGWLNSGNNIMIVL